MDTQALSVSQYLDLVNQTLKHIPSKEMLVEGEVSDYRVAQGKWVSFDLKDEQEEAVLKCFMTTWQLKIVIEDGMRVQIKGYPKIYERFGSFKMNVQEVQAVGEGALRRAYELLKKKLQDEGLFDVARKRELPRFPERIGLITSRDAAAYGDFVRVLNNRWGGVRVLHTHVHVQGREAVSDILGAFQTFSQLDGGERPDVIVLTRGGGGLEDLHAFNDELVARAIFASPIPVVCAVGHERDESLADFVADVRASTPSNAAERVVPSRPDLFYEMETLVSHMESALTDRIQEQGFILERATSLFGFIFERQKERLDRYQEDLFNQVDTWIPRIRERLGYAQRILHHVNPTNILARGYSLVTQNGSVVKDASELEIGSEIGVQFASSFVDAKVLGKNGKGQQKLI